MAKKDYQASGESSQGLPAYLRPHERGCVLSVWLQPGAKRNAILGEHGGALRVAVQAVAQRGEANEALLTFLAETLDLSQPELVLLHGHTARRKQVLINSLNCREVHARLTSNAP